MSNTKHTPGHLALIFGKDGVVIHSPMHGCVATVKHDNNPHREEHEANAKRIVMCWNSHDELLEAIENYVACYDGPCYEADRAKAFNNLKIVMKKATDE